MDKKQRLWIVSELYYPETTSTGYILTKIAEGLAGDFEVHALCAQPSYAKRGMIAVPRERRNGVNIHRCPSTTLNKDVLVLRLLNLVTVSISLFLYSIVLLRPKDIVLVVTNPPAMPFFIRAASGLRRARTLLLVHDVYPELLMAVGKLNPRSFIAKVLGLVSLVLCRSMDRIFVLGKDMQKLIEGKLRSRKDRVTVAPNWAELDSIRPLPKSENELLKSIQAADKFVVLYAGNMGYPHDLETIVKTAEQLQDQENIQFLFIGSGFKKNWLMRTVREKSLLNVSIMPALPRGEQIVFLNACDVSLISLVEGMKGISVPSRFYNILASGKPIIALVEPESEIGLSIIEDELGWVVPPGRSDLLTKALIEGRQNQDALRAMGRRSREVAEAKYSIDHSLSIFRQVVAESGQTNRRSIYGIFN